VLDGLKPERGVLTIATTNYPEKLDPALAQRPSRFDRVWRIPMPGAASRKEFLTRMFENPPLDENLCEHVVRRTRGWSMAYVQELKATAAVRAVNSDRDHFVSTDIEEAVEILSRQFRSGQKGHRHDETPGPLGFAADPRGFQCMS
jgi:ATP-dependent 26S proteasome regulatory subunit